MMNELSGAWSCTTFRAPGLREYAEPLVTAETRVPVRDCPSFEAAT